MPWLKWKITSLKIPRQNEKKLLIQNSAKHLFQASGSIQSENDLNIKGKILERQTVGTLSLSIAISQPEIRVALLV